VVEVEGIAVDVLGAIGAKDFLSPMRRKAAQIPRQKSYDTT
jgi:hypothetical protein